MKARALLGAIVFLLASHAAAAPGVITTLNWQDTDPVPSYRIYRSAVAAADWIPLVEVEALRACEIKVEKSTGHFCKPFLDCKLDVPDDEHDYRVCRMSAGIPIDCDAPIRPTVVCTDARGRAFPPEADIGIIAEGIYPGPPGGRCP